MINLLIHKGYGLKSNFDTEVDRTSWIYHTPTGAAGVYAYYNSGSPYFSPTYSAYIRGYNGDDKSFIERDVNIYANETITIESFMYYIRVGGSNIMPSNEYVLLEYWDGNSWIGAKKISGLTDLWSRYVVTIPVDNINPDTFRIRFLMSSNSTKPFVYLDDISIYNDKIDAVCTRWDYNNFSSTVECVLDSVNRKKLIRNIVPGAVCEAYNILGEPHYLDTTFSSGNTIFLKPMSGTGLYKLRNELKAGVKNYSDSTVGVDKFLVKLNLLKL